MAPEEKWHMFGSGPESYESHMVPALFSPWGDALLKHARLKAGERVLDAACGTGILARMATACLGDTGEVFGVDLNPAMLEFAHTISIEEGNPITWRQGNLEALPFAAGEFDVVLCQQGLQFCLQRAVAVREMYRVLREGGRLVLSVWRDLQYCPFMVALTDALADHLGYEASQRMAAPCSLGNVDELRQLMKQAGFNHMQVLIDILPMRVTSLDEFLPRQFDASPLAADIGALDEGARLAFFDDIKHRILPYIDDRGLAIPFEAHTIVAN